MEITKLGRAGEYIHIHTLTVYYHHTELDPGGGIHTCKPQLFIYTFTEELSPNRLGPAIGTDSNYRARLGQFRRAHQARTNNGNMGLEHCRRRHGRDVRQRLSKLVRRFGNGLGLHACPSVLTLLGGDCYIRALARTVA